MYSSDGPRIGTSRETRPTFLPVAAFSTARSYRSLTPTAISPPPRSANTARGGKTWTSPMEGSGSEVHSTPPSLRRTICSVSSPSDAEAPIGLVLASTVPPRSNANPNTDPGLWCVPTSFPASVNRSTRRALSTATTPWLDTARLPKVYENSPGPSPFPPHLLTSSPARFSTVTVCSSASITTRSPLGAKAREVMRVNCWPPTWSSSANSTETRAGGGASPRSSLQARTTSTMLVQTSLINGTVNRL